MSNFNQKMLNGSPLSLINGTLLMEKQLTNEDQSMGLHLDSAHLRRMNEVFGEKVEATNLGVIENLFYQTGYKQRSGIWFDIPSENRLTIGSNGLFSWQMPAGSGENAKLMAYEKLGGSKVGIDQNKFRLKFDKKLWEYNVIISPSRYSKIEALVSPDSPIVGSPSEGYWYTLITTSQTPFIPEEYLRTGTPWFRLSSYTNEYETKYDALTIHGGMKTFYNYAPTSMHQKHFQVTRKAAQGKVSNEAIYSIDEHRKIYVMHKLQGGDFINAQKIQNDPAAIIRAMSKGGILKDNKIDAGKSIVHTTYVPALEYLSMAAIDWEIEQYAMWGAGGMTGSTQTKGILPVGLFTQLMKGNIHSYNLSKFNIDRDIIAPILELIRSRTSPDERVIKVRTGEGGMRMVMPAIREKLLAGVNLTVNIDAGVNRNFTHYLESTKLPLTMGGYIEFIHDENLDAVPALENQTDNPTTANGDSLSSYCFLITDIPGFTNIADGGTKAGIYQISTDEQTDFHIFYKNGKAPYLGYESFNNHAGDETIPGYKVFIEKGSRGYFVANPGKYMMILPINPKTGRRFGQGYFD